MIFKKIKWSAQMSAKFNIYKKGSKFSTKNQKFICFDYVKFLVTLWTVFSIFNGFKLFWTHVYQNNLFVTLSPIINFVIKITLEHFKPVKNRENYLEVIKKNFIQPPKVTNFSSSHNRSNFIKHLDKYW